MSKVIISPSFLCVEKDKLSLEISRAEKAGITWLHYDVMDGQFVEKKILDYSDIKSINKMHHLFRDIHLMIINPQDTIDKYLECSPDCLTFHYEACKDDEVILNLIKYIHEKGCKVGLSINPDTKAENILKFVPLLDMVLVMSVVPGKGGQSFIPNSLDKIKLLKEHILKNNLNTLIEVDGGVNDQTGKLCKEAGVDVLVAGTYLMGREDLQERIKLLNE